MSPARPARRAARTGIAAAAVLALAGCGRIDAALSRQSATVTFRPDTSAAVITAAGRTCGHEPGVRPAPAPAVPGTAAAPSSVRYDVSGASTHDLVALQQCLVAHFPGSVLGVSLKDVADQG
ncbi:MAG TPA: hypothetical protein VFX25_00835 [Streptosporangiaceae bacterium]|nr:hypothetical protein [Streptosporangiaceae bacterium]